MGGRGILRAARALGVVALLAASGVGAQETIRIGWLSSLTGPCGAWEFTGGSAVYDPEGRPVAKAGAESPAVVVADLDPAEVVRVQELNPVSRDRLDSLGVRHRVVL